LVAAITEGTIFAPGLLAGPKQLYILGDKSSAVVAQSKLSNLRESFNESLDGFVDTVVVVGVPSNAPELRRE
jgi:hypothetical protein